MSAKNLHPKGAVRWVQLNGRCVRVRVLGWGRLSFRHNDQVQTSEWWDVVVLESGVALRANRPDQLRVRAVKPK